MPDNVLSWAFLAVTGWVMIGILLSKIMENPSTKLTESDYITKTYHYL